MDTQTPALGRWHSLEWVMQHRSKATKLTQETGTHFGMSDWSRDPIETWSCSVDTECPMNRRMHTPAQNTRWNS